MLYLILAIIVYVVVLAVVIYAVHGTSMKAQVEMDRIGARAYYAKHPQTKK